MVKTVDAIYEDGKLVLQQPLPLPEHAHVRVTIDSDLSPQRSQAQGLPGTPDLEREAWLRLSKESLEKAWDDPADDIFNELLQK